MDTRVSTVIAVGVVSLACFLSVLTRALAPEDSDGRADITTQHEMSSGTLEMTSSAPVRIGVPSVRVDSPVEAVGMTKNGAMGSPPSFSTVAWYAGTSPGEMGTAVFAGHLDNGLGQSGAFSRLEEVRIGDTIYVTTESGTARFIVDEVRRYPKDAGPIDRVFGRADAPRVALITCAGAWLPRERTYADRLVVYGRLAAVNDAIRP